MLLFVIAVLVVGSVVTYLIVPQPGRPGGPLAVERRPRILRGSPDCLPDPRHRSPGAETDLRVTCGAHRTGVRPASGGPSVLPSRRGASWRPRTGFGDPGTFVPFRPRSPGGMIGAPRRDPRPPRPAPDRCEAFVSSDKEHVSLPQALRCPGAYARAVSPRRSPSDRSAPTISRSRTCAQRRSRHSP